MSTTVRIMGVENAVRGMDPDFSDLDEYLADRGVDGYLIDADSTDSDQYYLSGFDAPDPFLTLYDGDVHLLFSRSLEYGRATKEARADTVERYVDFDHRSKVEEHGPREAVWHVLAEFLDSYDVESIAVPPRFPLSTADGLRDRGVTVEADDDGAITELRATKVDEEIEHLRRALDFDPGDVEDVETERLADLYGLAARAKSVFDDRRQELRDELLDRVETDRRVDGRYASVDRGTRRRRNARDEATVFETVEAAGIDREEVLSLDTSTLRDLVDEGEIAEEAVFDVEGRPYVRVGDVTLE